MTACQELKDFVSMAVCGLCDSPEAVDITADQITGKTIYLIIHCKPVDRKLVIGRQGTNIKCLQTLAQAIGAKHKINLTVLVRE